MRWLMFDKQLCRVCHLQIAMQERAQQQLLADTRAQWQQELADMKQVVAQRRTMLAAQVGWGCGMMYMLRELLCYRYIMLCYVMLLLIIRTGVTDRYNDARLER
jgi:hypothetical protein